jgi:predicted RNA-binding Zn ribbon-like protein
MIQPPFQFIGGALALDFINTVGNRRDVARRRDYLATSADALEWLVAAGLERDRPAAGRLSHRQAGSGKPVSSYRAQTVAGKFMRSTSA